MDVKLILAVAVAVTAIALIFIIQKKIKGTHTQSDDDLTDPTRHDPAIPHDTEVKDPPVIVDPRDGDDDHDNTSNTDTHGPAKNPVNTGGRADDPTHMPNTDTHTPPPTDTDPIDTDHPVDGGEDTVHPDTEDPHGDPTPVERTGRDPDRHCHPACDKFVMCMDNRSLYIPNTCMTPGDDGGNQHLILNGLA